MDDTTTSTPVVQKRDPYRLVGTSLAGRYRLDEYAGGGGMGAVYRSQDLNSDKLVAVKILKPDIQQRYSNYGPLFEREINAVRLVVHPHIVTVFDSGRTPDDIFYMVMEWLDGQTLEEIVSQELLSLNRVLDIFRQTCEAFQFAHAKKVIHLDIKPANIFLLSEKQPEDFIKVFDFGLSRILSDESGTTVTRFMGTYQYCSPEHFGGKVSRLSDVYSLGLTLYYLLAGVLPLGNSYIQAKQFPNLPLPPIPSLQNLRKELPDAVEAVIGRALSRNPTDRQQSAQHLYEDLRRAVEPSGNKTKTVSDGLLLSSLLADTFRDDSVNPKDRALASTWRESRDEPWVTESLETEAQQKAKAPQRSLFQFHEQIIAAAIDSTVKAVTSEAAEKRVGIAWQTQGTGLATTATHYLAEIVQRPELSEHRIVVVSDRVDLARQLWTLFSELFQHLGITATNVSDNDQLAVALKSRSHRIIFTTVHRIQKLPSETVMDKKTMLVGYDLHGYNQHLVTVFSEAPRILFTTIPLQNYSPAFSIFGDFIFKYSLEQAINDNFVLPVQIERRVIFPSTDHINLNDRSRRPLLESTEFIGRAAEDIVRHFAERDQTKKGKALVVVPNRSVGARLETAVSQVHSELCYKEDSQQFVRLVSSALNSEHRAILARRFTDPDDPFKLAITSGMWLTGLSTPLLKTIYLLKRMSHQSLLQVVGRVARASKDVKAGLVVDYLGVTNML